MLAKELMRSDVITAREDQSAADVMAVLVREHIHGIPVVDGEGQLVGIVTQQDVFFASVTRAPSGEAAGKEQEQVPDLAQMKIGELMTSPAVSATEETDILTLCRMMHRMRIHRVPIVRDGELTGIISSLDICAALANGAYRPDAGDE